MVGEKIKYLIENQGNYPKSEVAKKIGISDTGLYNLFTRDSVETKYLEALAKIYEVPLTYFFDAGPTKKAASRESEKFGKDTLAMLMEEIKRRDAQLEIKDEQLERKDSIIMELIQRVGKLEVLAKAGLSAHFFCNLHTDSLTPNGLGFVNC